jgi:hypothetical protein
MWVYNSPVGRMTIFRNRRGNFSLQISDEVYGFYTSAAAAADDVYTRSTGCTEWDLLKSVDDTMIPMDLSEWVYIKGH